MRHLRFLHYENSGNLKNTAAPLSFRSGDRCSSGALSLNGATSLSSGTLWSIYVPYLLPLVALCQHFYCTAATLKFFFFVFNLWFASITWIVLCGVVGYVRPFKKKKKTICEIIDLRGFVWNEGNLFCSVRGDGKTAMKHETTESCNIHALGETGLLSSERKFRSVSPCLYFRNVTSCMLRNVSDLAFQFWLTSPEDALEGLWVAIDELITDELNCERSHVFMFPSVSVDTWRPHFFIFGLFSLASSVTGMDRFTWQGHICPWNEALWVIGKQWAMKNWSSLFFGPLILREHKNLMLFCMLSVLDTGMTF